MTAGPKELQPWIRDTEKKIRDLEQSQKNLENKLDKPRVGKPFAETLVEGISSPGVTAGSGFDKVGALNNGPEVQTWVPGPVIVTVTAHIRAVWIDGTTNAMAYGSSIVVVDGVFPSDVVDAARYWGYDTFQFRNGETITEKSRTISVTRPIVVGKGNHVFRVVHLNRHLTTQIYLAFSRRSIIVEAV